MYDKFKSFCELNGDNNDHPLLKSIKSLVAGGAAGGYACITVGISCCQQLIDFEGDKDGLC